MCGLWETTALHSPARHPQNSWVGSYPPRAAVADKSSHRNKTELWQLNNLLDHPNGSFHLTEPSCHGLMPVRNSSPHSSSLTAPDGMGERTGRGKVRKLMSWDKDSLTCKSKALHANKEKQGIYSPLPWAGMCSVMPRKAGLHLM